MNINFRIKDLFSEYSGILKFPFLFSLNLSLNFEPKLSIALFILGSIGILRNFLEVFIGGAWANEWFALTPDIFFTMFFYPIYLCFFPTMILYLISKLLKLDIQISKLFSLFFLLQISHLFIPFFDCLGDKCQIPHSYLIQTPTYIKMIFSPLAFTPFIMFFTRPTSLGINITWFFITFILIKLYIKQFKQPVLRSLLALGFSFYILYISIYPNYSFFLNERQIGNNYLFGLFFMLMSIPSIIFVYRTDKKHNIIGKNEKGFEVRFK